VAQLSERIKLLKYLIALR